MAAIRLNNWASELERRGKADYYQWRVFVDAPPEVLNSIAEVEYRLHPTFANPVQRRADRTDGFALDSQGWGEFTIQARIRFIDGTETTTSYWLDLGKPWPSNVARPSVRRGAPSA